MKSCVEASNEEVISNFSSPLLYIVIKEGYLGNSNDKRAFKFVWVTYTLTVVNENSLATYTLQTD